MAYTSPKFNGEPSAAALANGLATLGRYGDSYMVHASDGETLIPGEIFDANPKLKEDLFAQMRKMGVQDPNRFVVGNSLNSINPITGQPEFFFKKIFKAVKKVFKKALPYVAPIVGNMIAPGIGGIIASGLVTKLQGGSWGDVAKNAAISYGIGALGQGLTSSKGFMAGLGEGLEAPWHAGKALFSGGPKNPLAQGIFGTGKALDLGLGFSGGPTMQQTVGGYETLGDIFPTYQRDPTMATGLSLSQQQRVLNAPKSGNVPFSEMGWRQQEAMSGGRLSPEKVAAIRQASNTEVTDILKKAALTPSGQLPPELQTKAGQDKLANNIFQKNYKAAGGSQVSLLGGSTSVATAPDIHTLPLPDVAGAAQAVDTATSTAAAAGETLTGSVFADKVLSEAALPVGLGALVYFLSDDEDELTPEQQRALADPQRNAYDQYLQGKQADPNFKNTPEGQSLLAQAGIVPSTDPVALARATGTTEEEARTWLGSMYGQPIPSYPAAKGGIITLQGGGEIMGPGSGISDSIPARLSDGEFVMTADAVRGAGNGSRDMGAARMYDLMSRFERAA